jgi:N,N'-diacetyllegionaminate synthase
MTYPRVKVNQRPSSAVRERAKHMNNVFIIAEAGVNHNGSLELAIELIKAAKACGADAVKFQTFRAEHLATRTAQKAKYQKRTTAREESQLNMLRRLQLGERAHRSLLEICRKSKIQFLSSPFDDESADLLAKIGLPIFKIPSGEITNLPFLRHIARKKKPMILSTGMSTLGEVEEAIHAIKMEGACELSLLHCVTEYPAPYNQINLRAMETLRQAFGLPVGYSDHTPGIEVAVAAVALGAVIIEKHLTLDQSLPGPDHKASLEPQQFSRMVQSIRNVSVALGDGIKRPAPCEIPNMTVARKSVVAARDLDSGHKIAAVDLLVKRPGNGIPPKQIPLVIGRRVRKAVSQDELITWKALS